MTASQLGQFLRDRVDRDGTTAVSDRTLTDALKGTMYARGPTDTDAQRLDRWAEELGLRYIGVDDQSGVLHRFEKRVQAAPDDPKG